VGFTVERYTGFRFLILGLTDLMAEGLSSRMLMAHRLIACSIAGRSQAPEKVIVADLFYLRGWMLVQSTSLIFWIVIDMTELLRLHICEDLDDTRGCVAPGPERQQAAATGALEVAKGAPYVDEGDQAVSAPVQAPQPPHVVGLARTMAQRLGRL
ncbi:hypothetical protein Tco_1359122, partial [Tanacetum coccineum]